jgi:hypothetical protein
MEKASITKKNNKHAHLSNNDYYDLSLHKDDGEYYEEEEGYGYGNDYDSYKYEQPQYGQKPYNNHYEGKGKKRVNNFKQPSDSSSNKYNKPNNNYHYDNSYKQHPNQTHKHNELKRARSHQDISNILRRKENLNRVIKGIEVPELTMNLINGLIEQSIECLICNDMLKDQDETWECQKCFTIFHNTCIYDWIFKLNSQSQNVEVFKWTCPHCSNVTKTPVDKLPTYNCYCGRFFQVQNDKHFNPNLIPHGCGLRCNNNLCKHLTCKIPCHPGPHMTCNVIETVRCYCAKSTKDITCGSGISVYTCGSVCEKVLSCGKHKCQEICHDAECESFLKNRKCQECVKESKAKFSVFLKQLEGKIENELKEKVEIAEGLSNYIFHGILLCGQHSEEVNTDNSLKLLLKILQVSGPKLVENIKTFIPVCKQEVDNNCNCGTKKSKNLCYRLNYSTDILKFLGLDGQKVPKQSNCTKVCKALKSCKVHKCNRVCCELMNKAITNYSIDDPNGHHLCLLPCDKVLSCGKHNCEDYCHKSNCKPCAYLIKEGNKYCTCGKTKLEPPYQCGAEPFCVQPCIKPQKCEHKCKLTCHNFECPPCDEITFKICKCKKTVINNIKCGSETPSCTTPCGEMLACGSHFCNIICHEHTDEFDLNYFCTMQCGREMSCKHKCTKRCHGESECFEVGCEAAVKILCSCKVNSRTMKCGEYKKLIQREPTYILPCSEECKKVQRLKKIEECFQGLEKFNEERFGNLYKKNEDVNSEDKIDIKYTDVKFDHLYLKFAKHRLDFIIDVENTVEKALKNLTGDKYQIPKLDKNTFITTAEFLKIYYNIKTEKGKKQENTLNLVLSDCSEAHLPQFRLSLFGLLFKTNRFIKNPKINHPFEMSIYIHNYRFQVTESEIDEYISQFCAKNDFYVDEIEKSRCYVHFFRKDIGMKVFEQVKSKPSQFQDCYDVQFEKKADLRYKDLYQYLRDEEYLNFATSYEDEEEGKVVKEGGKVVVEDSDGFVKVSNKKGKK